MAVTVKFGHALAYRAADEGMLLDDWAHHLADTSHLVWELTGSQLLEWMERVSFKAHAVEDGVRHFMVVTPSTCLEVLVVGEPTVAVH